MDLVQDGRTTRLRRRVQPLQDHAAQDECHPGGDTQRAVARDLFVSLPAFFFEPLRVEVRARRRAPELDVGDLDLVAVRLEADRPLAAFLDFWHGQGRRALPGL